MVHVHRSGKAIRCTSETCRYIISAKSKYKHMEPKLAFSSAS